MTAASDNPELDVLAPGVSGILFDTPEGIYIPLVISDDPGHGHVSAFLDGLPKDKRVVFPVVINKVLEGMLIRRGFRLSYEKAPEGDLVDIYQRSASNSGTCPSGRVPST